MSESDGHIAVAREWVERAALDVENARALIDVCPTAYANVVFLAQQAVEKIIKAFLVVHDTWFPKIHTIDVLLDEYVAPLDAALAQAAESAVELTDYAVLVRYPPRGERIDRATALHTLELMDRAWELFEPRILELLEDEETADGPGASEDADDG